MSKSNKSRRAKEIHLELIRDFSPNNITLHCNNQNWNNLIIKNKFNKKESFMIDENGCKIKQEYQPKSKPSRFYMIINNHRKKTKNIKKKMHKLIGKNKYRRLYLCCPSLRIIRKQISMMLPIKILDEGAID